ncbi:MAG: hypothetical protein KDJ52_26980 [Anaerolineae bacterium]|nr:hypothetical protein [Anaerolineae bacterium]
MQNEIARKIELAQSTITLARQGLSANALDRVAEQLETAALILSQMEQYITQVTANLPHPTLQEQDVSENPLVKLSGREREVLQLLAQAKSTQEISDTLNISVASVYTYNRRIKDKLDLRDLPSLIRFAMDHNLLE